MGILDKNSKNSQAKDQAAKSSVTKANAGKSSATKSNSGKPNAGKPNATKPNAVQQSAELSDEQFLAIEKRTQKVLAIGGFAAFGLLVGFLWGANQMVAQVNFTNALSQATKVACLVAVNTADWGRGLIMGIVGTVVGAAFGISLFMTRRQA